MAGCRRNVELPALVLLLNIISKANLILIKTRKLDHSLQG